VSIGKPQHTFRKYVAPSSDVLTLSMSRVCTGCLHVKKSYYTHWTDWMWNDLLLFMLQLVGSTTKPSNFLCFADLAS